MFWLRVGAIAFAGSVTLGIFLNAVKVINFSSGWEKWVWGISLAIIAVESVGTLISRKVHKDRRKLDDDIESTLMSILITLCKTRQVRFEELGACVFIPKRRSFWAWLRRDEHHALRRTYRHRPAGFPPPSGVGWTKLSGTVGQCWTQRKTKYWDGVAIAKRHTPESISALTEDSYVRIASDTRQGFTLEQFQSIAGKYSEVIATPIWDARKEREMIGVLTVDRAYVAGDDGYKSFLNSERTRETVEIAARQLGTQLRNKDEE